MPQNLVTCGRICGHCMRRRIKGGLYLLFFMKLAEGDTISDHLLKLDKLFAIRKEVGKDDMVVVTLGHLPRSFQHFVETLNNLCVFYNHI
jgi:hypothetical protein